MTLGIIVFIWFVGFAMGLNLDNALKTQKLLMKSSEKTKD